MTAISGCGSSSRRPLKRISPLDGSISPAMRRSRVVLPQPDGPTTQTNSCGRMSNWVLARTGRLPSAVRNECESPRTDRSGRPFATCDSPRCHVLAAGDVHVDAIRRHGLPVRPVPQPFGDRGHPVGPEPGGRAAERVLLPLVDIEPLRRLDLLEKPVGVLDRRQLVVLAREAEPGALHVAPVQDEPLGELIELVL